jgi:hypothetical protein
MWHISLTRQKFATYTNCLSCFRMVRLEVVNFYICQHKIYSECSVFLSPEYVILDNFSSGVAGQAKINYLIFSRTLSNPCCQLSYFPQWSRNHCVYAKSWFTTVTCIPVLMVCNGSKHWNITVHFFFYSLTDT